MKRGLAFFIFSILVLSSSVFAQNLKSSFNDSRSQKSIVEYAGTRAFSDGRGVWLEWQTSSETKNLGFLVYRLVGKDKELVSPNMISGSFFRATKDQNSGDTYSYFDPNGNSYDTYYIESMNMNGEKQFSREIFPQFISDIKTVAGKSAIEMTDNLAKSNSVIQENNPQSSKSLKNTNNTNNLAPDPVNQRWVAAQPGVRIGIKKEGFYRVTRAELQANGFDVNSSPTTWRMFLNGNEQSIGVQPNGDYIEFYGTGLDRRETDTQVYFLISGTITGKRIQTTTLPSIGNSSSSNYTYSTKYKYRARYVPDILNGDTDNFFGSQVVATTDGVSINFEVPEIDCDALTGGSTSPCNAKRLSIAVSVQGLTLTSHTVRVELNGVLLGFLNGNSYDAMQQNYKISVATPGRVNQGTNVLKLSTTGTSGDVSLLESISINYGRRLQVANNQLSFITKDFKKSTMRGFTSANVRVFDLINPEEPAQLNLPVVADGATFKVDLPSNNTRAIFAVEDSALATAAWVVPNTTSALTTTTHNANFIIVTHKNFTAEANAWATMRAGQGLLPEVIQVDDIYDEFNYGAADSLALRNFFEYAKNNWQTPPQYILLIGDASYDYRNYEGLGQNNYIPTKMVDTVYMETGSDETLADFNDDGLAEISIGRIPARTAAEVSQIMNKTILFEQSLPQWISRGALFAYDQPNGYDFLALSQRISTQLPANMPIDFIGRTTSTVPADVQANQIELLNSMSTGKYLVNYSGHGASGTWAVQSFFSVSNMQTQQPTTPPTFPQIRNTNNFSVFMMLTCLNGYFIRNDFDSLGEKLLKAKWYEEVTPGTYNVHEVGAAASWTSSGKTTPDVQEVMAARFLNQITAGNMTRFGDFVKDAKAQIIGGRDVRLSWVLLGDPTLKLR